MPNRTADTAIRIAGIFFIVAGRNENGRIRPYPPALPVSLPVRICCKQSSDRP